MDQRLITGWREWVRLPQTGRGWFRAKIDTGARSSALHAHDLRVEREAGTDWALFHLLGRRDEPEQRFEVLDMRTVRSSNGHIEDRPLIRIEITLGPCTWPVDVTLTDRTDMTYRMLVGREALAGRILVDPARSYAFGSMVR